jgi:PST family polysaccharide transporter
LRRWKYLIGDGTLVLLARGLGTFVVVGDYLMLGRFHSERVLGIYFFAFNLSMQSMILLALNMEGVVFPALSKIRHDPGAQHRLLMQTVRSVGLLGVPACLLQAALAAPGIWAVFDPKWAPAIPVLQVLSIGMAFRIIGWPAGSMLLAQGRYKTMVATAAGGAVSFMAIVSVASACSPERNAATVVAIAVASYFAIEAPIRLYIASGASINEVYRAFAVPMLLGATAVACGFGAAYLLPEMRLVHWARIGVTVLVAVALYGAALRYLAPGSLEAIRRQLGRTATVPIRQRPTHVSEEITGEATTCSPCLGKPLPRLANGVRRVTP